MQWLGYLCMYLSLQKWGFGTNNTNLDGVHLKMFFVLLSKINILQYIYKTNMCINKYNTTRNITWLKCYAIMLELSKHILLRYAIVIKNAYNVLYFKVHLNLVKVLIPHVLWFWKWLMQTHMLHMEYIYCSKHVCLVWYKLFKLLHRIACKQCL